MIPVFCNACAKVVMEETNFLWQLTSTNLRSFRPKHFFGVCFGVNFAALLVSFTSLHEISGLC